MGHGMVRACLLQDLLWMEREGPNKAWVSPNGNRVWVYNGSPAMVNSFANSDWQERLRWGRHAVQVAWAPNRRVF